MDGLALSSFGMSPEEFPALTRNARETMGGLFEVDPVAVSDGDVLEISFGRLLLSRFRRRLTG